jgi:hypothetical protein
VAISAASLIGGIAILFATPKPLHELVAPANAIRVS